jgi:hypothetical protein
MSYIPNCFLVGDGTTVKIGDFGLSRHVGSAALDPTLVRHGEREITRTHTGSDR